MPLTWSEFYGIVWVGMVQLRLLVNFRCFVLTWFILGCLGRFLMCEMLRVVVWLGLLVGLLV